MVAAFEPDALLDDIMAVGMKLGYVFDFGNRWVHTITVEKLIEEPSELPKRLVWFKDDNVEQYPIYEE